MKVLLDKNKPFFKANLHCHSTYSDGHLTVEELKEAYKKRGYSIVAFTDHDHVIDNSHLNDKDFLAITSCEMAIKEFPTQSTLKNFDMRVAHLNLYARDMHNNITPCYSSVYDHYVTDENKPLIRYNGEYERRYSAEGINEIIRIANEAGFIVAYNHPSWSLENAVDYLAYDNLFAVEIYNTACVTHGGEEDERAFTDMLFAGKRVYCTACDDNHNARAFDDPANDSFGGCVYINADKLDYSVIMQALQKGEFYASTGAQILSLVQEGNTVTVETTRCKRIDLVTHGRRREFVYANTGEALTKATFTLRDLDGFFRIRVEDFEGKKAYSQAYYI